MSGRGHGWDMLSDRIQGIFPTSFIAFVLLSCCSCFQSIDLNFSSKELVSQSLSVVRERAAAVFCMEGVMYPVSLGPLQLGLKSLLQPSACLLRSQVRHDRIPTRTGSVEFSPSWVLVLFVGNGTMLEADQLLAFLAAAKKGGNW